MAQDDNDQYYDLIMRDPRAGRLVGVDSSSLSILAEREPKLSMLVPHYAS